MSQEKIIRVIVQYNGRELYRDFDKGAVDSIFTFGGSITDMTNELLETEEIVDEKIKSNN